MQTRHETAAELAHLTLDGPPFQSGPAEGAARGCPICRHIVETRWIGTIGGRAGSHCSGCCRTWTSKSEMHCVTCHQHFANPRACDTHIGHDGVHLDPATATRRDGRPRFVARNRPFGLTWSLAFYGEIPANFGRHVVEDGEGDDDLDPDYVIGTLSAEDDEGDGPAA